MKRLYKPIAALLVAVQLVVLAGPGPALAAPPAPAGVVQDSVQLNMEKAFNVAQAAAKYATLNEDGTVALNVSDPAVLGVSGKYLADMSAAIDRINSLVRSGELVIGADLSLKATAKSELLAEVAKRNEEEVAATRGKNNVDWYLYPYPGAFMLYFSTTDLHRYFSQNCGCLALLVASMCGYMSTPYLSPMLTRLFVYNPYFFRCCPSPFYSHGLYLYVPYSPCDCYARPAYRVVYVYTVRYFYSCYCSTTYWQGYWAYM